jgi:hypothetical protein
VDGFHYLQEDGDYAYVEQSFAEKTDLLSSLPFKTQFYVVKKISPERIFKKGQERIGQEIQSKRFFLKPKQTRLLDKTTLLRLRLDKIEQIYDSKDVKGFFTITQAENNSRATKDYSFDFTMTTADTEFMLAWSQDDAWFYLRATGKTKTSKDSKAMEIAYSLRVS